MSLANIALARILKVTFQKNVLVTETFLLPSGRKGLGSMKAMTHKQFWDFVEETGVEAFLFRPADSQFEDLVKKRIAKVVRAGFEVTDSESIHHYKYASR
ncbi:MAG: hypothetical protein OEX12_15175 [Gammaproteobacteria bacterium]|nr:hypothetical protein [Gammaproteobacteria bacterium]